VGKQGSALATF